MSKGHVALFLPLPIKTKNTRRNYTQHKAVIENNSDRFNFFSPPQQSNKNKYLHNFHINASFKCKLQLADKLMNELK